MMQTKKGLEYLLRTFPSDMPVIDAINKAKADQERLVNLKNQMVAPEGTVLFQTKFGVKLEVKNGGLYTTNEPEIRKALEEDLASDNPMDVQMAESVCTLMQKYGLVAEVDN